MLPCKNAQMRRMVLCVKSRLGPETVGRSQKRVVCFDLGGVLLRGDPGLPGRLARLFGVSRVAIDRAVMDHAIADDLILGVQTPRAACAVLNGVFGTTISRAAFVRAWTRGLQSSTANVRFLRGLRRRHPDWTFATASNLDPMTHAKLLRSARWYREIETRYTSFQCRAAKPAAAFFRGLLRTLRCRPERVFFIDDKQKNTAGARRLGLATYRAIRGRPLGQSTWIRIHRWHKELADQ
jgi:FMN phosphatase YigB (HAD superfamily)